MQCVILCAGAGTRLRPLTETTPKPLVRVAGEPILTHIVRALPAAIDEIVLVVGYRQEQIRAFCGEEFLGRRVRYAEQANFAGGTGEALGCARDLLTDRFLFMYADDIHGADALSRVVACEHGMLAAHSDTPERFGVLRQNANGTLAGIDEKPAQPASNLINIGGFVVNPTIFDYQVGRTPGGELLVTDLLTAYAAEHPVKIIEQSLWLPIGYPDDILCAEAVLATVSV